MNWPFPFLLSAIAFVLAFPAVAKPAAAQPPARVQPKPLIRDIQAGHLWNCTFRAICPYNIIILADDKY